MKHKFDEIEPAPEPDDEFWTQRTVLAHVQDFARARMVSPYAMLGAVLREAVACINPNVVLPPIVGGCASCNLYTAQSGRSGAGKDAANDAAREAIRFRADNAPEHEYLIPAYPHPGSGEGLARLFKGEGQNGENAVTNAHLAVNEVATLEALAGRQGATLAGELLKAAMGQPIGFSNNKKDTSTNVEAHSYRLCIGVGVQPENAGFFLTRTKDGFPQRFLFLPTNDPGAPDPESLPDAPEPLPVSLPSKAVGPYDHATAQRIVVAVPGEARAEVREHRHRVLKGDPGVDPLDGHLLLTQLKVAFALAVLDGRIHINSDDWKLGHELIEVSNATRAGLVAVVEDRRRRENEAKALDAADREAIVAARLTETKQRRVAQAITRKLQNVSKATRKELRQACAAAIRDDFDPVFNLFIDKGFLVCCEKEEGRAERYRLAE